MAFHTHTKKRISELVRGTLANAKRGFMANFDPNVKGGLAFALRQNDLTTRTIRKGVRGIRNVVRRLRRKRQ